MNNTKQKNPAEIIDRIFVLVTRTGYSALSNLSTAIAVPDILFVLETSQSASFNLRLLPRINKKP